MLLRNAPVLVGRDVSVREMGLACGVFLYWRLGYSALTAREQKESALLFLNDCRYCIHVMYRRLVSQKILPSSLPDALVGDYLEAEMDEVPSMWGATNQSSHILAESYLNTLGKFPVQSSWEPMPLCAALNDHEVGIFLRNEVGVCCSEQAAQAVFPDYTLDVPGRLSAFGPTLCQGFLVRRAK